MPPRLRVLHTLHDYLPAHQAGSELYVAHLCDASRRLGVEPTVLAAERDAADLHGRVRWRAHDGVPVAEVVNNWRAPSFDATYDDPAMARAVSHVLDVIQPDVVHVHNLLNLTFSLPAIARSRGIPVVATLHDYTLVCPSGGQRLHRAEAHVCRTIDPARCARCFPDSPFYLQWRVGQMGGHLPGRWIGRLAGLARRTAPRAAGRLGQTLTMTGGTGLTPGDIERRTAAARDAWAACDLVVSPSASLASEFTALGFRADTLLVSDYGFPALPAAARRPAPKGRLRVGFIGTLVWHKAVDVLIEAVRLVTRDRLTVTVHGDTSVFPDYVAGLRERAHGLPVTFAGRLDHGAVAAALAELDVLVVPSRWLENSPLVIHEAFQAGLAVIGADIGGISDLLADGGGLLVPPDDPAALAAALQDLADHPGRCSALAASAPRVKPIDRDAAEWLDRYHQVQAHPRGAIAS